MVLFELIGCTWEVGLEPEGDAGDVEGGEPVEEDGVRFGFKGRSQVKEEENGENQLQWKGHWWSSAVLVLCEGRKPDWKGFCFKYSY